MKLPFSLLIATFTYFRYPQISLMASVPYPFSSIEWGSASIYRTTGNGMAHDLWNKVEVAQGIDSICTSCKVVSRTRGS